MRKHSTKPPDEPELLDLYDVSVALHCSVIVAEHLCREGALRAERKGICGMRVWRIRREDLDRLLASAGEGAAGDIAEFHARLARARLARDRARKLLAIDLDWGGQDEPDNWAPAHIDWQGWKDREP